MALELSKSVIPEKLYEPPVMVRLSRVRLAHWLVAMVPVPSSVTVTLVRLVSLGSRTVA